MRRGHHVHLLLFSRCRWKLDVPLERLGGVANSEVCVDVGHLWMH
eukprot:SAG31_NODE_3165_length_4601_cov_2.917814_6_plen_45_part_00